MAHPVQYSPAGDGIRDRLTVDIKDLQDNTPSDSQPPGVDDEVDYNSLEEALTG